MSKVITIKGRLFCDEYDHDMIGNPPSKCGFPIPCPYHTPIINIDSPNLKTELEFIANKKRRMRK